MGEAMSVDGRKMPVKMAVVTKSVALALVLAALSSCMGRVTTQPLRRGSSSLQLAASPYGTRARSGTPL
jgi:hypothetical protein